MSTSKSYRLKTSVTAATLLIGGVMALGAQAADQRVVRDPQTGAMRAPNADESQALDRAARESRAADRHAHRRGVVSGKLEPKVETRPDGSSVYELPEEYMTHMVVTRQADGSLKQECLPAEAAKRVASGKKTAFTKTLSERAHEVK